ncbi:hypothetical protein CA51_38690 [Rosistilla oblonga]|nr:hypothetical protein CA51_38690 [Rosistilla oblonga]
MNSATIAPLAVAGFLIASLPITGLAQPESPTLNANPFAARPPQNQAPCSRDHPRQKIQHRVTLKNRRR